MTTDRSGHMSVGPAWPAEIVELWDIGRLKAASRNARLHTKADIKLVARSIKDFGFTTAILADEDGEVIAGHARMAAAHSLGLKLVPVMVARGWSQAQKDAYRVADNQLVLRGTWDEAMLGAVVADLKNADFDLTALGFGSDALAHLIGSYHAGPTCDPDEVPAVDLIETPVTKAGDLWILGENRVLCGDCTKSEHIDRVLGGLKPPLMVTDPPYGDNYDPKWRRVLGRRGRTAEGAVLNDDRRQWEDVWRSFPGDIAYIWHAARSTAVVAAGIVNAGFELRAQIIWAKQHFAISRGDYHWQHEPCWYAVRKGATSRWTGGRKQSTVWEIQNNNAFGGTGQETSWGHGTQKPVECMRRPIENNSKPGETVFDPFLGTGTTLIAAVMTGRRCVGLELNPAYADVIVRRWQRFTGHSAIHAESGESFDSLAAIRAPDGERPPAIA